MKTTDISSIQYSHHFYTHEGYLLHHSKTKIAVLKDYFRLSNGLSSLALVIIPTLEFPSYRLLTGP